MFNSKILFLYRAWNANLSVLHYSFMYNVMLMDVEGIVANLLDGNVTTVTHGVPTYTLRNKADNVT